MSSVPVPATPVSPTPTRPCPACRRDWGAGIACQFCDQVSGLPSGVVLSSPGRRLGAHLLDGLLMIVTLYLGWLVWSIVIWNRGQTPGKQLLHMRTVVLRDAKLAGIGRMALREIVAKTIIGFLAIFTVGIIYFWLVWDRSKQELWDKVVGTIVVTDAHDQLDPKYAGPPAIAPAPTPMGPASPTVS